MTRMSNNGVRAIVFDLDGTLYTCEAFAATIQEAAAGYIAGIRGITAGEARELMAATRRRLAEESGTVQTLSAVCRELGGTIQGLHAFFETALKPESFLVRDERVIRLLRCLAAQFPLFVYTNNNRILATRIVSYLGFDGIFRQIFAIDDAWLPKPDERSLERVLQQTGFAASELLFVGDRYDVDLRLPEQFGCPVYLTTGIEQLMRLEELL